MSECECECESECECECECEWEWEWECKWGSGFGGSVRGYLGVCFQQGYSWVTAVTTTFIRIARSLCVLELVYEWDR